MQTYSRVALTALLLTGVGVAPALAKDCSDLAKLALKDTQIDRAERVEAGKFAPPPSPFGPPPGVIPQGFKALPAFCRVSATLTPTDDSDIKVEVWLPAEGWNGKLVGIGNGVWAGSISYTQLAEPVGRGYAAVATDTGHVGTGMDAKWAVGHDEKLVDFGYRAVHEMVVTAKAMIKAFYSEDPKYSYWTSCSTGGRQGLMEAYRYPDDFDGISAMAPANPMTRLMTQSMWTGYAALKSPDAKLSMPKLAAVHDAYIKACDANDGVEDGLVSDPDSCHFAPKVLQCKGADGPNCLTAAQVETMSQVYGGVVNPRTDKQMFPGFEPGSEMQTAMLMNGPQPFPVATSYMADLVFKDPKWDFMSFDYDKDTDKATKAWGKVLDVPSDGLGKFFKKGGKLLLSHGWSDGLIPARNTVTFYEAVLKDQGEKITDDQLRLFMVPGMGHCSGGNGPFLIDVLTEIDQWVTTGNAPDRIIGHRPPGVTGPNAPAMSRPLCPYPQVAHYNGSGDENAAENFTCKASM